MHSFVQKGFFSVRDPFPLYEDWLQKALSRARPLHKFPVFSSFFFYTFLMMKPVGESFGHDQELRPLSRFFPLA